MRHRLALIFPGYVSLLGLAFALSFVVRFEFQPNADRLDLMRCMLPLVVLVKLLCAATFREFQRSYRFATINDLVGLAVSTATGSLLVATLNLGLLNTNLFIPRSIICLDALLSLLLLGAFRLTYRFVEEVVRPRLRRRKRRRTLIYGVGDASIGIQRMLSTMSSLEKSFRVVGFLSSSPNQRRALIAGKRVYVLSDGTSLSEVKTQTRARNLLIPSDVSGREIRELLHECSKVKINVQVIPSVCDLADGRYKLSARDVTVSDLLRREPNQLDFGAIRGYVTGKRVMVTGGAGSIGSELCRQILDLNPESLVVFDQSEFGMFSIEQEFSQRDGGSASVHYIVGDVVDDQTLNQVMTEHRPQLVFHAAAYKHVPLMEDNPQAAVLNNVIGTRTVADMASRHTVERFVLISTDKAVRPTSVMGASKLLAEKYVQSLARTSPTRFITVRFGNVLNSLGSVVPTFRRQIEQGGPVTVTHPDMERFFMTIPEAVQLVLQAGAIGPSGKILILDMGEPVKIVDLAKDMILLSGLRYPDDIEIEFTGMRPGEKLYEELFYPSESGSQKLHEKIYCGGDDAPPMPRVLNDIRNLEEAAETGREATLLAFRETVAGYSDADWIPTRLRAAA